MYIISFRLHGAPPQIPLGELTALPILLSLILEDIHLRGMGERTGKRGTGRSGEKREGNIKAHP